MRRYFNFIFQAEAIHGKKVNEDPKFNSQIRFSYSLAVVLCCWLAIWFLAKARYSPPAPVTNQNVNDFSASRAEQILKELVGDSIPHPAGSEQNKVVRDKIIDRLRQLGYQVEIHVGEMQPSFVRNDNDPESIELFNIIATYPGDPDLKAVVIAAHHDSVPNSPGASDDGVAVAAILDIAALAKQQLFDGRTVIFLITDGEEYGLLGADALVRHGKLVDDVEFVVNLEARGTSGPSLMFQVSDDMGQMIELFASHVKRPVTSSIFEEVYKRLRNDTDFTVFRNQANWRGFNFAFIGDARNYHTPDDNFDNFDRGSMQHHGDNAWQLLKALHALPAIDRDPEPAVYFDFYAWFVIWWPGKFTLAVCSFALLMFVIATRIPVLEVCEPRNPWWKQSVWISGSSAAALLAVSGIDYCLRLEDRLQTTWLDYPEPIAFSFWILAIGMAALVFSLTSNHDEAKTWKLVWGVWAVIAAASSVYVPGACYLFVIPMAFAAMIRILFWALNLNLNMANSLTAAITALLWVPIGILFYDAVGFSILPVTLIRILFVASTLFPILANNGRATNLRYSIASSLLAIFSIVVAIVLNPVT